MPSTEQRIIDMADYSSITKGGDGKNHKIKLDVYVDLHEPETAWIKVSGVTGVGLSIPFESDGALTWIMTNLVREIGSRTPKPGTGRAMVSDDGDLSAPTVLVGHPRSELDRAAGTGHAFALGEDAHVQPLAEGGDPSGPGGRAAPPMPYDDAR